MSISALTAQSLLGILSPSLCPPPALSLSLSQNKVSTKQKRKALSVKWPGFTYFTEWTMDGNATGDCDPGAVGTVRPAIKAEIWPHGHHSAYTPVFPLDREPLRAGPVSPCIPCSWHTVGAQ